MAETLGGQTTLSDALETRGLTRRDFFKFCGGIAALLGMSQMMVPKIADALEQSVIGATSGKLTPAIWLELSSCTGCTESLAQVKTPDIATIVLELISLNYTETLAAGAGKSLEEAMDQTIEAGNYVLIAEGSLMEGWDGNALRIAGETSLDLIVRAAQNAVAIVSAGTCAVDGGWQAAAPNPGGAIGVEAYLNKAKAQGKIDKVPPIVNIPCCPANPENVVAVLVDYILLGKLPVLNSYNMPSPQFDQTIHDNCPRRGHFENGEFVYQFGSEEEEKQYCLYAMGCKGPQTKANCPQIRWNDNVGWCIQAGAPCIGCATAFPNKQGYDWVDLNTPFLNRFKDIRIGDISFDPTWLAYIVGAIVVVALVAHGFGMKAVGRVPHGAEFEVERKWDKNHPDKRIGATIDVVEERAAEFEAEHKAKAIGHEAEVTGFDKNAKGGDE